MSAEHEYAGPEIPRTNLEPIRVERKMLVGLFFAFFKQLLVERWGFTTSTILRYNYIIMRRLPSAKAWNLHALYMCDKDLLLKTSSCKQWTLAQENTYVLCAIIVVLTG